METLAIVENLRMIQLLLRESIYNLSKSHVLHPGYSSDPWSTAHTYFFLSTMSLAKGALHCIISYQWHRWKFSIDGLEPSLTSNFVINFFNFVDE